MGPAAKPNLEAEPAGPSTPEYHHSDEEVEGMDIVYSIRAPEDWVLSGPLGVNGGGPGRRFASAPDAEAHVRKLHGDRVMWRIREASNSSCNRWAWLIRGVKK